MITYKYAIHSPDQIRPKSNAVLIIFSPSARRNLKDPSIRHPIFIICTHDKSPLSHNPYLPYSSSVYMPEQHTIMGTSSAAPPDSYYSRTGFFIRCILSFPDSSADNSLCSYTGSDPDRQYQTSFPQAERSANAYMPHQKKAVLS